MHTVAAAAADSAGPVSSAPAPSATVATAASSNTAPNGTRAAPPLSQSRFCRQCGSPMEVIRPQGDNEWRHVCTSCKYVDYFNPKMVVGCIVEHAGKLLLCRRAIEPCRGKWTVPAGFLELSESTMAGAARETMEEAGAQVDIIAPFMHLDIPTIGQSYLLFHARLAPPFTFHADGTSESLETRLVDPDHIPWSDIAFSSVQIALRAFCEDLEAGKTSYHHGTIRKVPGSAPNDPTSFELIDHFVMDVAPRA